MKKYALSCAFLSFLANSMEMPQPKKRVTTDLIQWRTSFDQLQMPTETNNNQPEHINRPPTPDQAPSNIAQKLIELPDNKRRHDLYAAKANPKYIIRTVAIQDLLNADK